VDQVMQHDKTAETNRVMTCTFLCLRMCNNAVNDLNTNLPKSYYTN